MQSWEIQSSADVEVFCITVNFISTHNRVIIWEPMSRNCAEEQGQTQKGESGWIQTL